MYAIWIQTRLKLKVGTIKCPKRAVNDIHIFIGLRCFEVYTKNYKTIL